MLTAAMIAELTASGNTVRFLKDGSVTVSQKSASAGAERVRRHRENRRKALHVTQCNGDVTPTGGNRSVKPNGSHGRSLVTGGDLFILEPALPVAEKKAARTGKREKAPKEPKNCERFLEIQSRVKDVYENATDSPCPVYDSSFWGFALRRWLKKFPAISADAWLHRFHDVLQARGLPMAGIVGRAANPVILCNHWEEVESRLASLHEENRLRNKPREWQNS